MNEALFHLIAFKIHQVVSIVLVQSIVHVRRCVLFSVRTSLMKTMISGRIRIRVGWLQIWRISSWNHSQYQCQFILLIESVPSIDDTSWEEVFSEIQIIYLLHNLPRVSSSSVLAFSFKNVCSVLYVVQESHTVCVQRVNCAITGVIRNGTIKTTKSRIWGHGGSRIRSVVLHMQKALCLRKCMYRMLTFCVQKSVCSVCCIEANVFVWQSYKCFVDKYSFLEYLL